jgi:hypothetical protein
MYEKIRKFVATHLAPINTIFVLFGMLVGVANHLGWFNQSQGTSMTQPASVIQPASAESPSIAKAPIVPPHEERPKVISHNSRDEPVDTIEILRQKLDKERLQRANDILDAQLK